MILKRQNKHLKLIEKEKRSRNCKMKIKRQESDSHKRSFVAWKQEHTSSSKNRKYKAQSDCQFNGSDSTNENLYDRSFSSHPIYEFINTPKSLVRASPKKPTNAKKQSQDMNYKSCGKHNGNISIESLENSFDQLSFTPKKLSHRIEIEDQTDPEEGPEQEMPHNQKLPIIRKLIEDSETALIAHWSRERKNRFNSIIEKYTNAECEDIVDVFEMKIKTAKSDKYVKMTQKHLHLKHQNMSDKTVQNLKYLKRLRKTEYLLIKKIKMEKSLFSKRSHEGSGHDSFSNSNKFTIMSVSIDNLSHDTQSNLSDTDKTPVKSHSILSNSSTLQNQTNLFEAEKVSDSDESEVTIPLGSPRNLTASQQFGGLNNASSKEKHINKLFLNSPAVPNNHIPVRCTFIRKAGSTQNHKVSPEAPRDLTTSQQFGGLNNASNKEKHFKKLFSDSPRIPLNYIPEPGSTRNHKVSPEIPRNLATSQQFGGLNNASSKQKHFNKLFSNSAPTPVNHISAQYTFIRKTESIQNHKVSPKTSKYSVCCLSDSNFETLAFSFNSKSSQQLVVNSFNDSLIPQVDSCISYTSEEPKSYVDETRLLRNQCKNTCSLSQFSPKSTSWNSTNPSFSEKDVSSILLDSCSSMNESSLSSKSSCNLKKYNMNYHVSRDVLKYINKDRVSLKKHNNSVTTITLKNLDSKKSNFNDKCSDFVVTPTSKSSSTGKLNALDNLHTLQSTNKYNTQLRGKSKKLDSALSMDSKKVEKNANKEKEVTKRKRSEKDIDDCSITKKSFSPKVETTIKTPSSCFKKSSRNKSANKNYLHSDKIPHDVIM